MTDLPNIDKALFQNPDNEKLQVSAVRPSYGKTHALLKVSGDSQSFNAVYQMRILGR